LKVEILDEGGRPLTGYSAPECDPIRSDSLRHVIRWGARSDLGALRGKPIRLRFLLRGGNLYAFWFRAKVPSP
jgi:hypothetical protein